MLDASPPTQREALRKVVDEAAHERGPGDNDTQFFYNSRKKAWKVMKKPFWEMGNRAQEEIMTSLQAMFRDMFTWMNVGGTSELVRANTTVIKVAPPQPDVLRQVLA